MLPEQLEPPNNQNQNAAQAPMAMQQNPYYTVSNQPDERSLVPQPSYEQLLAEN